MPGKLILVKPGRLAKFIAKPASGDSFGLPSGPSAPTGGGGELRFFKGDRADVFPLPVQSAPFGWKGLGSPAGSKGFKYKGHGSTLDPCKTVLVKSRIVKGICRGGRVRLDPPAVGPVGILLTVGSTPKKYLALYGGTTTSNTAELLKRKDAPAPPVCDCGATTPTELRFANGVGVGVCGNATDGTTTKNFDCGKLVIGGGQSPVPTQTFQDMVDPARLSVSECTGKNLIIEKTTLAQTGSNRQCTDLNCLFAPPLPIILPSVPQSACVYMRVSRPGRGTVQCDTGDASIDMDILVRCSSRGTSCRTAARAERIRGRGAAPAEPSAWVVEPAWQTCRPAVPDLQPEHAPLQRRLQRHGIHRRHGHGCPVHAGRTLVSGPQFPTSHDCTVSSLVFLGDIPIPFELSTGTTVRKTFSSDTQTRVFCGYCRDADSTLCFEGDPDGSCPSPTASSTHASPTTSAISRTRLPAAEQRRLWSERRQLHHRHRDRHPRGQPRGLRAARRDALGHLLHPADVQLDRRCVVGPARPGSGRAGRTLQLSPGGAFIDALSLP
jgi:hypothetical protein